MTNLQKFAAQRLTKSQMNNIKGGQMFSCRISTDGGKTWVTGVVEANSAEHAAAEIALIYLPIANEVAGLEYDIECWPK